MDRADAAATAAKLLTWPQLAVVQVDLSVPQPASQPARPGGARTATAAHVRTVDGTGGRLLDVTVRLVGPPRVPDRGLAQLAQPSPSGSTRYATCPPAGVASWTRGPQVLRRPGWNEPVRLLLQMVSCECSARSR